jgi:hypothetical protein
MATIDSERRPNHNSDVDNQLQVTLTTKEHMASVQRMARLAAVLYLLIAVIAGFVHGYVPGELIVTGDATATATRIMASEGLLRLSMVGELILLLSEIALSVLLYVLLRPVNRTLSLVAAVSRLVMTTIHGINLINQAIVLLLLSGASYLTVFAPDQLHALVLLFLDAYSWGFQIGIVFLVLHAFPLGYLIYRSAYFPKLLGVLFMVAALGYLLDSLAFLLLDNYKTGPVYFALPIILSEIAFPLWLLFKGVNADQWLRRKGVNDRREAATTNSFSARPTPTSPNPLPEAAAGVAP